MEITLTAILKFEVLAAFKSVLGKTAFLFYPQINKYMWSLSKGSELYNDNKSKNNNNHFSTYCVPNFCISYL